MRFTRCASSRLRPMVGQPALPLLNTARVVQWFGPHLVKDLL
ncbi:hypothetical protein [Microtetraspora sp. NBRC 16547]|nr:hypothetical protein [Microtetraspora sp. NBRC 16547]